VSSIQLVQSVLHPLQLQLQVMGVGKVQKLHNMWVIERAKNRSQWSTFCLQLLILLLVLSNWLTVERSVNIMQNSCVGGAVATVASGFLIGKSLYFIRKNQYELFILFHILLVVFFFIGTWIMLPNLPSLRVELPWLPSGVLIVSLEC
jgi:hypothetical protein